MKPSADALEVLRLRLSISQAATKKFNRLAATAYQGRIHDTLQFCGAGRTGRWAGRGLQTVNQLGSPRTMRGISRL